MIKQARTIMMLCVALFGAVQAWGDSSLVFEEVSTLSQFRQCLGSGKNARLTSGINIAPTTQPIALLDGTIDVTIDLNGHNLNTLFNSRGERIAKIFELGAGAKLTLMDSAGGGAIDGKCVANDEVITQGGAVVLMSGNSEFTINGGTIKNFIFDWDEESGVWGGLVHVRDDYGLKKFTMNGGQVVNCTGAPAVVFFLPGGEATLNGGLFHEFANSLIGYCGPTGTFLINGGVFKNDVALSASGCVPGEGVDVADVGELGVVGKNVTTADGKLTGGTFYFDPSASEYSSVGLGITGVSEKQSTDPVTWKIVEASNPPVIVCEMDGIQYTSISGALAKVSGSASAPRTIKLLTNVTEYVSLSWNKKIKLDLNGWVLKAGVADGITGAILVQDSGTSITIVDTSTDGRKHYFNEDDEYFWTWNQDTNVTAYSVTGGCIVGGATSGGALSVLSGSATLQNVTLVGNTTPTWGGFGAAIYLMGPATCLIENCKIMRCRSYDVGGAVCSKGDLTTKNVTIDSCYAGNNGGAIMIDGGTFRMNSGTHFVNCAAGSNGGGVYMTGGTFVMGGDVTEVNADNIDCVMIESCKTEGGNGGGICLTGGTLDMVCGALQENTAKASGGTGGYAGGLYIGQGTANIRSGIISCNRAMSSYYDIRNQGGQLTVGDGLFISFGGAVETFSATTGATKLHGGFFFNQSEDEVAGFNAVTAGNTEIYGGVFMGVPSTIENVNVFNDEAVVDDGDTGNYTVVGQSVQATFVSEGEDSKIVLDAGTFTFDPSGIPYNMFMPVELGGTLITNATVPVTWTVMQPYKPIPSQPPTVQYATAAVYTNGVLSADGIVWSNQTATVVYTARKGHAFADGATTATVTLDTTVSPATIPAGTTVPQTTLLINPTQNVPRMVPYQGMLTDAAGQKYADGAHTIDLRIWNDAGGTARCLWGARYSVYVQNGRFSVLLGNPNAQDLGEADGAVPEYDKEDLWMVIWNETAADGYYLGITPRDDAAGQALETCAEITPRARILAAPFAFRAQRARYAEQSLEDFKVVGKLTVAGTTTVKGQLNVPATGTQQFGPIVMTAKDVKLAGATSPASSQPTLYTMANQLYLQSWGNTTFGSTAGNVNLSASSGRAVKVTGAGTFTSTLSANTIAGAGTTTVKGSPIVMKANSGQTKFTQDASNITIGDATNFKVTSPVFNARSSTADSWVKGTTVNFLSNGGAKLVLNGDKIVAEGGATHWNSSTGWDVPMTFQTVTVSLGGDVMESTAAILADKPNNNARFEWTVVGWHGRTSDGKEGYAPCRITLETENGLTRVRVRRNNEKGQDDKKNSWSLKITVCLMGINKSWCQWL